MTTEQRLEKLEKGLHRARQWRWFLAIGLGALAVLWLAHAPKAAGQPAQVGVKALRANRFVVIDEKTGNDRAVLGVLNGEPSLILFDKNGKGRLVLLLCEAGVGMHLRDDQGRPQVDIVATKHGPRVLLSDQKRIRAALTVPPLGASLLLFDTNGKRVASLGALPKRPTPER